MEKIMATLLSVGTLATFSLGCADIRVEPNEVKCPKCGATFTSDEGEKEHLRSWVLLNSERPKSANLPSLIPKK